MAAPKSDAAIAALEAHLGHVFKDRGLLREALTHGSALGARTGPPRSYERLEFLGDRVLGVLIAERMWRDFPDAAEDGLAPRFNALVNRDACARAAERAQLGPALILGVSEAETGGRSRAPILADACEAVIAALYLDGGFAAAREFVERFWADEFTAVTILPRDPKTVLQEWAAAEKRVLTYEMMQRTGPEHRPHFVVEARIDGLAPARGEGGSKREAERAAAQALIAEAGIDG